MLIVVRYALLAPVLLVVAAAALGAVIRAGKSLRHYGVYADEDYYYPGSPLFVPIVRTAWFQKAPQAVAVRPSLLKVTDPYYRGWDLSTPDQYRFEEWQREFNLYGVPDTITPNQRSKSFLVLFFKKERFSYHSDKPTRGPH